MDVKRGDTDVLLRSDNSHGSILTSIIISSSLSFSWHKQEYLSQSQQRFSLKEA